MTIRIKSVALIAASALILAACQHSSQQAQGEPTASTSSTTAASAVPERSVLTVTPDRMTACNPAAVARLQWKTSAAGVQVYVRTGSNEKLFAEGGATGDAKTGPWVRPGVVFTAKATDTGAVLGTVTISGPNCPATE